MESVLACDADPTHPIDTPEAEVSDRTVRVVRVLLAIYLLPVVAVVLAIGGVALAAERVVRLLSEGFGATRPSGRRSSLRLRHEPHVATTPISASSRVFR